MGPDRVLRSRMEIYVDPPSTSKEDFVKPPPRIRPNALRDVTSLNLRTTSGNAFSFSSKLADTITKPGVPSHRPGRVSEEKDQSKSKKSVAEKPPPLETDISDTANLHQSADAKAISPAEDIVTQATENINSASSSPISPRKRKVDGIPGVDVSDRSNSSSELRTSKRYRTALHDHEGPGEPVARRHVSRGQKSTGDDCNKENWDPLLQMYTTDPRLNHVADSSRASHGVRIEGSVSDHDPLENPRDGGPSTRIDQEESLSGRGSRNPRADAKNKAASNAEMNSFSTVPSENAPVYASKPASQPKKQSVQTRTVEERTNVANIRAQPTRTKTTRDVDLSTLRTMR
ncbi:hypothetical protein BJ742DRAFT_773186 [Cladochytrium replicatum]|nr:hypothetical protein BJ742DRAFT_773186 [Cladochytrium replicatum]